MVARKKKAASCGLVVCWLAMLVVEGQAQDYTCNIAEDTCSYKEDSECDSEFGGNYFGCENGDCVDCNEFTCGQFDFDCEGCLGAKGCFWCPEDAKCYNYNVGHDLAEPERSCKTVSSLLPAQSGFTCSSQDNVFRYAAHALYNNHCLLGHQWVKTTHVFFNFLSDFQAIRCIPRRIGSTR